MSHLVPVVVTGEVEVDPLHKGGSPAVDLVVLDNLPRLYRKNRSGDRSHKTRRSGTGDAKHTDGQSVTHAFIFELSAYRIL